MLSRVTYRVTAQNHPDAVPRATLLRYHLAVPTPLRKATGTRRFLRLTIEGELIAGHANRIRPYLVTIRVPVESSVGLGSF